MRRKILPAVLVCTLSVNVGLVVAAGKSETGTVIDRVAKAYDRSDCRDVLDAIGGLADADQELALDGLSQYRWGFCLAQLGRGDATPHYRIASDVLKKEIEAPTARLEAYFYGVNALLNLKQNDDAAAAARKAIDRWKAGSLTVASDDPNAWFQLGKLFADGGDPKGAMEHYRKALDVASAGKRALRPAYTQRIADVAMEQNVGDVSRQAITAMSRGQGEAPEDSTRLGRLLLSSGDLEGARGQFRKAARAPGDAAMDAQYAIAALDRAGELGPWALRPADTATDGRPLAKLTVDELREALKTSAADASASMDGPVVELPRLKGPGTRPGPRPDVTFRMHDAQARFTGLLLEAVKRGAPLQEWSIVDGYAQLIHNPWNSIFLQRGGGNRDTQIIKIPEQR